ncbi:MAG: hypothetical protein JNL44_09905 [Gemmatimonadetes bacterium]|nr:hypothetical protein [Gemmatimonadota bacterium]
MVDLLASQQSLSRILLLLGVRLAVLAIAFGIILRIARLPDERKFDFAVPVISYAIVLLVVVVHLLRPASFITQYFVETLVIIGLYAVLPARWTRQLGPALLITVIGIVLLFTWHTGYDVFEKAAVVVVLVLANALGIAVGWHQQWLEARVHDLAERELQSRLALASTTAELRILHKILPICAHCRNVRDGKGAWAELEAYVHSHSDTRFSHGICPDCMEKHYPETASAPAPE